MSNPDGRIIVVGAGLAGLTCAAHLHAAGLPVTVLEAADRPGGRATTERTADGFLIDRGFQVLFPAYPAVRRNIDLATLGVAPFDAGMDVWTGSGLVPLVDPLRHPGGALDDLRAPFLHPGDAAHLAALAARVVRAPWDCAADAANAQAEDRSIATLLAANGFSHDFIEAVARGFWGGITLDRRLAASEGIFLYTLKMLLHGAPVLPAGGLGAVAEALANRLPVGAVRYGQRVSALLYDDQGVAGVRAGVEEHRAAAVVVAADPAAARALTGIAALPDAFVGFVTVFLASDRDAGVGRRLLVDSTGACRVNHIAPLSAVQPAYAPPGRHLVAAVLLGDEALKAEEHAIAGWAVADASRLLPGGAWTPLRVVRTPRALYAQPPGSHRRLPDVVTGTPGLFLASDATVDASINGAMLSGEAAARAVRLALPDVPGGAYKTRDGERVRRGDAR